MPNNTHTPRKVHTDPKLTRRGKPRQRTTYTPDQREGALDLIRDGVPLADVHRQTGIPKGTLSAWRVKAGLPQSTGAAVARTEACRAATAERHQRARLSAVEQLERIVTDAGSMIGALMENGAEYAELVNALGEDEIAVNVDPETGARSVVVADERAELAFKRGAALVRFPVPVRDLVGVHTRGIHDLQLLKGEATERAGVEVVLALPRPPVPDAVEGEVVE